MFCILPILWCLLVFTIGTRSQDLVATKESIIKTKITNRYAETNLTILIRNDAMSSKEHSFMMAIPENAFISFFECMQGDHVMTAKVLNKETADRIYADSTMNEATAGIVSTAVRNSNEFNVTLNIKKNSTMACTLKYDEFLKRETSEFNTPRFEHIITCLPDQLSDKFTAEVTIDDSLPLQFSAKRDLHRDARLIINTNKRKEESLYGLDGTSIIKDTKKKATFQFTKAVKEKWLELKNSGGISLLKSVELHVLFDVKRGKQDNIVAVKDEYFMHSVVPDQVERLSKYVIFVLDVSGSMSGSKLRYLKDAMQNILGDLREKDYFSILTFNTVVSAWTPQNVRSTICSFLQSNQNNCVVGAYQAQKQEIIDARNFTDQMTAGGGTDIYLALQDALKTVKNFEDIKGSSSKTGVSKPSPMIMLLSDGKGRNGIDTVISHIDDLDMPYNPIHTLAFGKDADINFLRKISKTGLGEFREIFESEDAAIQLNKFYWQVCNPKMKDVTITYGDAFTNITQNKWEIFYEGEELIVSGKVQKPKNEDSLKFSVIGKDQAGAVNYNKTFHACFQVECGGLGCSDSNPNNKPCDTAFQVDMPVGANPARMHAFLQVKDLLAADESNLTKQAVLNLALKHQFVTPFTSLVFTEDNGQNLKSVNLISSNSNGTKNNDVVKPGQNDVTRAPTNCNETASEKIVDITNKKCAIVLYPDTGLRNISKPELRLSSSNSRLRVEYLSDSKYDFNDELLSFKTEGDCCWEIFEGGDFTGRSKIFSGDREYKHSTDLGPGLIKDASSLMASRCCIEDFYELYQSWDA